VKNEKQMYDLSFLRQSIEFNNRLAALVKNAKNLWVGTDTVKTLQGLSLATAWGFSFPALRKLGENWQFSQAKEGVTGWVDNWMIGYSLADKPKMKLIAEEWINYSISPEVQADYFRDISQLPVNTETKALLTPKEIKQAHLDSSDGFIKNFKLWRILSKRQQNGYQQLWDIAKKRNK